MHISESRDGPVPCAEYPLSSFFRFARLPCRCQHLHARIGLSSECRVLLLSGYCSPESLVTTGPWLNPRRVVRPCASLAISVSHLRDDRKSGVGSIAGAAAEASETKAAPASRSSENPSSAPAHPAPVKSGGLEVARVTNVVTVQTSSNGLTTVQSSSVQATATHAVSYTTTAKA